MIRNKTNYLNHFRPKDRTKPWREEPDLPPVWFDEYYTHKQSLKFARTKSIDTVTADDELERLVKRMSHERGMNLNRQINSHLETICNELAIVENWAQRLPLSDLDSQSQVLHNIRSHFLSEVAVQLRRVSAQKMLYTATSNEQQANTSLVSNRSGVPLVQQQIQLNSSAGHINQAAIRERDLQFVSEKIEEINLVLRRMNNLVFEQGTMVDRIDYNIVQAQTNIEKANRLLEKRVDYEEGRGEWTFTGRANKCIMCLYLTCMALILVWMLKHLIKSTSK